MAASGRSDKVLLTDGEFKHTLGMARALAARGHDVHLVARSGRAPAAHSRAVHRVHYLPAPNDPNYANGLLELAIALAPVSVIAVGDGAVRAADEKRGRWPRAAAIALPPRESLQVANDKAKTGALARSLGVDTPREFACDSLEEAQAAFAELGGRAVVKSRFEAGRKILRYARSEAQLALAFDYARAQSGAGPLVQEYVEGDGWAYFALYWQGVWQRHFMHRRIREWPPSGGTSAAAESVLEAPELERAGVALLDALKWHGVAMVEGKRTKEGRFVLMEINAKFWGSHDLALAAGVDFPNDLVTLLQGGELTQPQKPYKKVRCTWPLGGDLWHAMARPTALPRVLWDGVSPNVAHTFRWTDPGPWFFELLQWARSTPNALAEARKMQ